MTLCREKEFLFIKNTVNDFKKKKKGGVLYLSGISGTGKTHVTMEAIGKQKHYYVNCSVIESPRYLYALVRKLIKSARSEKEKSLFPCVSSFTIVVIDEVDLLVTRRQEVLYSLFEWPRTDPVFLILLSNTVDLAERILKPKIASRLGLLRINFPPYTHSEFKLLLSRFDSSFFSEGVLEFCARKAAATGGDLRRTIQVVEKALSKEKCVTLQGLNLAFAEVMRPLSTHLLRQLSKTSKMLLFRLIDEEKTKERLYEESGLERYEFIVSFNELLECGVLTENKDVYSVDDADEAKAVIGETKT